VNISLFINDYRESMLIVVLDEMYRKSQGFFYACAFNLLRDASQENYKQNLCILVLISLYDLID
jgi:hypothetical protein